LLDQKEAKNQGETPNPILFSRKNLRNSTEKIVFRAVSPKQPHYYQRMINVVLNE
jgi:hypothetical protein